MLVIRFVEIQTSKSSSPYCQLVVLLRGLDDSVKNRKPIWLPVVVLTIEIFCSLDFPALAILTLNELIDFRHVRAHQFLSVPFDPSTFASSQRKVSD